MAWWGEGVLDGDRPMAAVAMLEAVIGWNAVDHGRGLSDPDPDHADHLRSLIEDHQKEIDELFENGWSWDALGRGVDVQAWAQVILDLEAPLSERAREIALWAVDNDGWARVDGRRRDALTAFRRRLEAHAPGGRARTRLGGRPLA